MEKNPYLSMLVNALRLIEIEITLLILEGKLIKKIPDHNSKNSPLKIITK